MPKPPESRTFALGMVLVAWLVGLAVHVDTALALVTAALAVCLAATLLPPIAVVESLSPRVTARLVAVAVAIQVAALVVTARAAAGAIGLVGVLALAQILDLRRLRAPLVAVTCAVFCVVASVVVRAAYEDPRIDVYVFQQMGAAGLLHGIDPYAPRYPNLYGPDTPVYGHGVLDAAGRLTFGFPYPPASLLLVLPGYLLGGDVRYADVVAAAASALVMIMAGQSAWAGLAAALFLLTPRVFYVLGHAWTEPLLAFTFSLVMLCALRWRNALPYALGLFLATKQTAVLAILLVPLLLEPAQRWTAAVSMTTKALIVAAVVTAPFVLWDAYAFWRSVVQLQFMQPLRTDAISHLVWMHARWPELPLLWWIPFIVLVATTAAVLWRSPHSPARFAGALTVVNLAFVAFNKQAFSNYYYFVIATACWAAAVAVPRRA
jgi:hypothetical protein